MKYSFQQLLKGYQKFRNKYANSDASIMYSLHHNGQQPKIMVISCCDSRVDPALILQSAPGDLFVVRNIANIIPPYEKDEKHHGTSAALEFGICFLKVAHLIILGHSQCGGIKALLENETLKKDDFITSWVSLIKIPNPRKYQADDYAKLSLEQSYQNCMTFPWIKERMLTGKINIHLWFFNIQTGEIYTYCDDKKKYQPLLV